MEGIETRVMGVEPRVRDGRLAQILQRSFNVLVASQGNEAAGKYGSTHRYAYHQT